MVKLFYLKKNVEYLLNTRKKPETDIIPPFL